MANCEIYEQAGHDSEEPTERRTGMDELLRGQARLEQQAKTNGDRIEWLEEAIRGNGKPGINHRLMRIEEHVARMDYWAGVLVKVMLPILVAILVLGVTAWIKSVV